jgi:hypothetical protein
VVQNLVQNVVQKATQDLVQKTMQNFGVEGDAEAVTEQVMANMKV